MKGIVVMSIILLLVGLYILSQKQTNPSWLATLIKKEENSPVAHTPAFIAKCLYKNNVVYYVPPRCCDIPSQLYDANGNKLCSPDGGLIGKGDSKCLDFSQAKPSCIHIWQDTRAK